MIPKQVLIKAKAKDIEHHTLFQVSTSAALVQGVYQGCAKLSDVKACGDFGLGTYEGFIPIDLNNNALAAPPVYTYPRGNSVSEK